MKTKQKEILKFDSGADGFFYMCAVLAIGAFFVLAFGIYFLVNTF